jgi:hypothetical protein
MCEEARQQVWGSTEPAELTSSLGEQLVDVTRRRIEQGVLRTPVVRLLGVQVRRVAGQKCVGMIGRASGKPRPRAAGNTRIEPVPDEQQRTARLAPEVRQRGEQSLGGDRADEPVFAPSVPRVPPPPKSRTSAIPRCHGTQEP